MQEPSNLFVCLLGIGTVFIGLIFLILLCKIIGFATKSGKSNKTKNASIPDNTLTDTNKNIENRQEIIAAVSAAIAEDLGTDISALKIISFKKV